MKNLLMALVMTTYCFSAYAGTQPAVAAQSQQNKMKTCNADPKAKILKGDERKAFMKSCLSGK